MNKESAKNKDSHLNPNDILVAEFNYASQTAFQANEDRVRVFSYIVANFSTFVAAVVLPNLNTGIKREYFGLIFIGISLVGVFFILQLARLRAAWIDSVKAMSQIKDYYINNIHGLDKAFKWTSKSIPSGSKVFSLAFLLTFSVIFLDLISMGAGLYILINADTKTKLLVIILTILIYAAMQFLLWNKMANGSRAVHSKTVVNENKIK